jgi:V8-like Glu-specific endopeptidase
LAISDGGSMTRKLSVVVIAGVLAATLVPGRAASEHPQRVRVRLTVRSHDPALSPSAVKTFWTARRMRAARPLRRDPTSATTSSAATVVGSPAFGPGAVAPTEPSQNAHSTVVVEAVGGPPIPYERFEVADDYTAYPYSTNGRVFVTFPKATGFCSATAVNSDNRSVVVSAAHCMYQAELGGWFTSWNFVPAYKDGDAPLGEWPATTGFVASPWIEFETLRHDVGAVVVAQDSADRSLVDVVGGRGIAWNIDEEQTFQSFGYPARLPFTGERMISCVSAFGGNDVPPGPGPLTLAMGCDMTAGSSGGGWIVQDQYLNSVTSYGVSNEDEVLYGPYFGNAVAMTYATASNEGGAGPLTHNVTISMKLRRHLTVRGRMMVRDGHRTCKRDAIVRVERRRPGGGWKVVGSKRTNHWGRYRIAVNDKAGRYRAFAPARVLGEKHRCSASTSPTKKHSHRKR